MSGSEPEPPVLIERVGTLGRIRLNRPRALNSLTLEMVRYIDGALDLFEDDQAVGVVLISGEGARGLCAGGDIRSLYESGLRRDGQAARFLREEYRLNARIARFPKPYVAIMDGVTMGGGVGVSAHGRHRIVTEASRVAMPETGIGFLPDVGGTWLLPRAPGEIGTYLALTGEPVGAADAIYARLADRFVRTNAISALVDVLASLKPDATNADVVAAISVLAEEPEPAPLSAHRKVIDRTMGANDLDEILTGLAEENSSFARGTADAIRTKSPTSLALALMLLRLGRASRSLEECLEREFAAAVFLLDGYDFYEGVRAAVIRKDRNPQWRPSTLADVDSQTLNACLAPASDPVFPS
jgi:enoyl-CoA hydratase